MWTDIRFGALHGSFAPVLFGTAVPCGNGLSRFAGFPHQAVIQPRIKTRFVVGIGPGGLAKTSPQILETIAHHFGNVPESGKVLVFRANVERSRFATCGGTPDPIDLKAVEATPISRSFRSARLSCRKQSAVACFFDLDGCGLRLKKDHRRDPLSRPREMPKNRSGLATMPASFRQRRASCLVPRSAIARRRTYRPWTFGGGGNNDITPW